MIWLQFRWNDLTVDGGQVISLVSVYGRGYVLVGLSHVVGL